VSRQGRAVQRSEPARALVALAALLAAGCASSAERKVTGADFIVDDITFVGAHRFTKKELIAHITLREKSWWPFSTPEYFTEGLIPADRQRIEDLYHAYGYPDARVVDVKRKDEGDHQVDLTFVIEEGRPIVMRRQVFEWPEGLPAPPDGAPFDPTEITAKAVLTPGAVFTIADLNTSVADMRVALQERGYPEAAVQERATVDRDAKLADVAYELTAGRYARIGDIRLEGLVTVPQDDVEREVSFARGKPYAPSVLNRMERGVFAMGVFRSVNAIPDKQVDANGRVGVTLRVAEAPPESLRLGLGLAFEPNRWEEHVDTRYTHRNLFGHLYRLDLHVLAGWAELPTLYSPQQTGPTGVLEPILSKKGLLEKNLVWSLAPQAELGIQEGYSYFHVENRIGVARFFGRLSTELSHTYRYFNFFNLTPAFRINRTILGPDFRDPSTVSFLESRNALYLTDSILQPERGVVAEVNYRFAGGPVLGGQFDFQSVEPEVRAYWFPFDWLQLAARGRVGFIFTYGNKPGTPIDLKFYLGGADTVRGWGLQRLSPQISDCERGQSCRTIPIGGDTEVLGNFEARFHVFDPLWLVPFLDVGDVEAAERDIAPSRFNYSSGLGARYVTPVGRVRVDIGIRLNHPARFADEPGWAFHLGLGEMF
jgi:outer membrane protein assembly factor BamA